MGQRCPKCDNWWDRNTQFCGECGAELKAAARRGSSDGKEKDYPREPGPTVMWLLDLIPGVTRPGTLICAILALALSLAGLWLAVFIFQLGAMISAFAIGGGAVIIYWAAVCWILYGYVCVPAEAMAEFQGKHWMAFFLATAVPGSLFLLLMKTLAERGGP